MHTSRWGVLRQQPGWARPFGASLIGRLPESMISVALVLLVRSSAGSYLPAGLTAAGYGLGSACAAPLTGRGVDRHGPRALLLALVGVFAGALTALVFSAGHVPVAVTIALAALAGVSRPPLESAMRALWPRVLETSSLSLAYTIDAVGQDLVWIGGPLLLSGLLILDGPRAALLGCAAASILGTLLYVRAPATGARVTTPRTPSAHRRAALATPPRAAGRRRVLWSCHGRL
jgi:MFS family permease